LGPLRVTHSLLPALKDGAKIALLTSRDLRARGIAVAILHPGYVRTDMTGHSGLIDADESVTGLLERIDELNLKNSGSFWHANGELLPW